MAVGRLLAAPAGGEPAGKPDVFQGTAVGFADGQRSSEGGLPPRPPGPVVVPTDMRPALDRMWRDSPTFRRQCARLVDESVTVTVRLVGPSSELGRAGARTHIAKQGGRVTSVDVRLATVRDVQYLAHEIEHVLEQLDGVDLRAAVVQGLHGVGENGRGIFETARAIDAGAQVEHEVATRGSPGRAQANGMRMPRSGTERQGR
jgi:hypothetical protein